MKEKVAIKILISTVFTLIIDYAFSITEILREYLNNVPQIKEIILIKQPIILFFLIAEITIVYALINQFIDNLIEE